MDLYKSQYKLKEPAENKEIDESNTATASSSANGVRQPNLFDLFSAQMKNYTKNSADDELF